MSNLIVDCAEIQRLDIHPLLASGNEFTALDVTLDIAPFEGDSESRLAIRPYPLQLEEWVEMKNGERSLFRPILPEDEPQLRAFISQVTKEDLYYRYFSEINEFTHDDLANMTQIDYDREMAFVAVRRSDKGMRSSALRVLFLTRITWMQSLLYWYAPTSKVWAWEDGCWKNSSVIREITDCYVSMALLCLTIAVW